MPVLVNKKQLLDEVNLLKMLGATTEAKIEAPSVLVINICWNGGVLESEGFSIRVAPGETNPENFYATTSTAITDPELLKSYTSNLHKGYVFTIASILEKEPLRLAVALDTQGASCSFGH